MTADVGSAARVGQQPGVWADLVGQDRAVEVLRAAVEAAAGRLASATKAAAEGVRPEGAAGGVRPEGAAPAVAALDAMTHAWLFTGPPGSGRSTAARAFAAALQCPDRGCGGCEACHTALAATHADVDVVNTRALSIGVDEARALVARASRHPAGGRWQVMVVEDADRLTEQAANALLKAIEEPTPRTVWLLCAPALDDVLPTIRSRCRHVLLRTPPPAAVAEVLVRRDGIHEELAHVVARAAQGHIGRARRLALDPDAMARRRDVTRLPMSLRSVPDALAAAADLVKAATDDATQEVADVAARETEQMKRALGVGAGSRQPANAAAQLKALEDEQKKRATRAKRDGIDRALVDLAGFYRDVLAVQCAAEVDLVNEELRDDITHIARASTPEQTVRRIDAVLRAREQIALNVAPLLAVEAMTLALRSA